MSENCTHDCGSCSANCASREGGTPDFSAKANAHSRVKKVIGVVSGKGGVGKSMVTSLMAVLLRRRGANVAILDADITGPSIPRAFGVLTSPVSFSCGNLLPALMRDQGMAVLGEQSGGGTCAVEEHATPEGFVYQFSSGLGRLVDAAGQPIDRGIVPDIPLDEADFYDLKTLSRAMNAFYAG